MGSLNYNENFKMPRGINKTYNRKIKIIQGKDTFKIVIKEYKNILGFIDNSIQEFNLMNKLKNSDIDDFTKSIIVERDKQYNTNNFILDECKKSIRKDNIVRSRNNVFDLAYMNENKWLSFITLTFKENISNVDTAFKKFNIWLTQFKRQCKKENIELYYLGVIEFQKRGAIHYHLLTNIMCGSKLLPLQQGKKNMYDVKYWNYGFSSAFDIYNDTNEDFSCAKYMCKYMTKKNNDDRLFGHKRYYHSRNLKKPITKDCMDYDVVFKTLKNYIKSSSNISLIHDYHHVPKEMYDKEYTLFEYEGNLDENCIIEEIIESDLDF